MLKVVLMSNLSQKAALAGKSADFSPILRQFATSRQFFPVGFCHCPATLSHRIPVFLQCTDHALCQDNAVTIVYKQGDLLSLGCFTVGATFTLCTQCCTTTVEGNTTLHG